MAVNLVPSAATVVLLLLVRWVGLLQQRVLTCFLLLARRRGGDCLEYSSSVHSFLLARVVVRKQILVSLLGVARWQLAWHEFGVLGQFDERRRPGLGCRRKRLWLRLASSADGHSDFSCRILIRLRTKVLARRIATGLLHITGLDRFGLRNF